MPDYLCVDGPLRGHLFASAQALADGDTVTVALLGLEGEPAGDPQPGARYAVESGVPGAGPGTLRFVAAHGIFRKPALPASLREALTA